MCDGADAGTFTEETVKEIFQYTGIREPYKDYMALPDGCELCVRKKDGCLYFFVLNYGKAGQEIELKKSMYDMETKENLTGTAAIGPYGVAVYRMPLK